MTTLAVSKKRSNSSIADWDYQDYPMVASDIIYEGAAVGDNGSGYIRPLVSGDPFRGFVFEAKNYDNSTGSAGDIVVPVVVKGQVKLTITGVALTDVGRPVYASDDDTFGFSIGSFIGRVVRYETTNTAIVEFDATGAGEVLQQVLLTSIDLANIANGDIVTGYTPGFSGRIKGFYAVVTGAATTAAKTTALNLEIGTTNLTGGVLTLTSANMTPLGNVVSATAITAGNAFTASDTISLEAASTTAFVEGSANIYMILGS